MSTIHTPSYIFHFPHEYSGPNRIKEQLSLATQSKENWMKQQPATLLDYHHFEY